MITGVVVRIDGEDTAWGCDDVIIQEGFVIIKSMGVPVMLFKNFDFMTIHRKPAE